MKLDGILAIANHTGYTESTLLTLARDEDFPMENQDSIWVSTAEAIEAWKKGDTPPKSTTKKVRQPKKKTGKKR